jgi:Fe-S-cluster-containing dehydrogenase component
MLLLERTPDKEPGMSKEDQKNPIALKKEKGQSEIKTDLSRRIFLQTSTVLAAAFPLAGIAAAASQAHAAQATPPAAAPAKPAAAAAPAKPKAKALMVQRKRCTGCNSCTYACSLFHDDEVRPATARIYVRRYYGLVDVPIMCWHCPDAPCVQVCPTTPKAIEKDKDSNVIRYTDEKRCLGASCNKCMEACPPQFLRRHPETAKPLFCDLCDGDPQCVQACARQSKESGETLRADGQIGGLHRSYQEVTPEEAADGLMLSLFYPNLKGERR